MSQIQIIHSHNLSAQSYSSLQVITQILHLGELGDEIGDLRCGGAQVAERQRKYDCYQYIGITAGHGKPLSPHWPIE